MRRPRSSRLDRLPSPSRTSFAAGLTVIALAVGVYVNALDNPFIYDDFYTVRGNASIASTADLRWTLAFMPFRPVVNLSYAVDRAVWGYRPFGYHLTSILLHAGVSLLLFLFLRRVLADAEGTGRERRDGPSDAADAWAAFAGAALFAVHPVQSETVGYISSRSEILCAAFVLGALLTARRAIPYPARGGGAHLGAARRTLAAAAACVCGLLAMFSKEVAVSLPVLLVAYDWLLLPGDRDGKQRRLARVYVPLGVLTLAALAYRIRSLAGTDATLPASPVLHLLSQSIVIWRYLGLMIYPAGQALVHDTRRVTSLADPVALLAAVSLAALAAVAFRARRISPLFALGAVWWFACIAPSSSVIALREGMAEHRVYVASAGAAIVAAALARRAIRQPLLADGRIPAAWTAALVALLALCSALTIRRNIVWDSPVSVWKEARRAAPDMWEARHALGDALREAGDCASALVEYEAVLRQQPRHVEAMTNLGICLGASGRLREAEAAFRRTLQIDPAWSRGYTNLAAIAVIEGNHDRAREYYLQALAVDNRNVHARMQLARIYEEVLQDYGGAARMCQEARIIAPSTAGAGECVARNEERVRAARGSGA